MSEFSLRQFVLDQHGVPWKLRLLIRRTIPWRWRRRATRGRSNLNAAAAMDATYAALGDAFTSMTIAVDGIRRMASVA